MAHLSSINRRGPSLIELLSTAVQHLLKAVSERWSLSKTMTVRQTLSRAVSQDEPAAAYETPYSKNALSKLSESNPYCVSIMAMSGQLHRK